MFSKFVEYNELLDTTFCRKVWFIFRFLEKMYSFTSRQFF